MGQSAGSELIYYRVDVKTLNIGSFNPGRNLMLWVIDGTWSICGWALHMMPSSIENTEDMYVVVHFANFVGRHWYLCRRMEIAKERSAAILFYFNVRIAYSKETERVTLQLPRKTYDFAQETFSNHYYFYSGNYKI